MPYVSCIKEEQLELFRLKTQHAVSRFSYPEICLDANIIEGMSGDMVYEITAVIAASLPRQRVVEFKAPETWWDHFLEAHKTNRLICWLQRRCWLRTPKIRATQFKFEARELFPKMDVKRYKEQQYFHTRIFYDGNECE